MLKEFIEYLLSLKKPEVVEVEGRSYATSSLRLINEGEPDVAAFEVRNLSGLVDYIQSTFDNDKELIIHVESPTKVNVFDALDSTGNRRTYIKAKAMLPSITYDRFLEREEMNIMLQSCFVDNEDKATVLEIISSVVEDEGVTTTDDGISQKIVVKQGVASSAAIKTKKTYELKPFRTFVEVKQPESEFILRLREGAKAALYEADGGAWELNAIHSIRDYFKEKLSEEVAAGRIQVIA
ncbi:hypothetical protein MKX79_03740 [Viridibacillus sp. FSL R5-0468]|uniref:hypothetical protein n=1 Tax=Viridibacillus sp. FSL R5-0468 TaxID=2921640 RepID=UPI0030F986BF